jgi:putative spermidine/putrescine transport system permease protein
VSILDASASHPEAAAIKKSDLAYIDASATRSSTDPEVGLRLRWGALSLPGLLFLVFSFGAPILLLFEKAFERFAGPASSSGPLTLINFKRIFTEQIYLRVLGQTLWLGFLVVTICALLAYPVAHFLARTTSKFRGILIFCVFGPLLVSSVIRNLGWLPLLDSHGLINWVLTSAHLISEPLPMIDNFVGVVIGSVHTMLPFMVLMLMTVFQRIDPQLEEAAQSLGAGSWRSFWLVLLPLSLPGLIGGYLIVFTLTISAYTTPAMLGGNRVLVMSTFIAQQVRYVLNYPVGAVSAILLMASTMFISILARRLSRGRSE